MKIIKLAPVILTATGILILNSCCTSMKSATAGSTPTPTVETEKTHGMAKPEVKKAN